MQGFRVLFNDTMDGLQMEKITMGINNLTGIDIVSIIIITSLVIHIL